MNAKSTAPVNPERGVPDPRDEAPTLTRAWADAAELRDGDRILREAKPPVRIGRPPKAAADRKQAVSIRLSRDVLDAARATGAGWQTRIDEALRKTFIGRR